MVIKATNNGNSFNTEDNHDTVKSIEFLAPPPLAIAYGQGQWHPRGADGKASELPGGTGETGLKTSWSAITITAEGANSMVGKASDGSLIFKMQFTPAKQVGNSSMQRCSARFGDGDKTTFNAYDRTVDGSPKATFKFRKPAPDVNWRIECHCG